MGTGPARLPPQRPLQGPKNAALVQASRAPAATPIKGRTGWGAPGRAQRAEAFGAF